jgi:hypothetical protein
MRDNECLVVTLLDESFSHRVMRLHNASLIALNESREDSLHDNYGVLTLWSTAPQFISQSINSPPLKGPYVSLLCSQRKWALSWAWRMQFTYILTQWGYLETGTAFSLPRSLRRLPHFLILAAQSPDILTESSSHLHQDLVSGLYPFDFPIKILSHACYMLLDWGVVHVK